MNNLLLVILVVAAAVGSFAAVQWREDQRITVGAFSQSQLGQALESAQAPADPRGS